MFFKATYRSTQTIVFCVLKDERLRLLTGFPRLLTTSCLNSQKHQITYKAYVQPAKQDHDRKNMKLKRPMSPHLTVYMPTVPSMTSITQRITGVMLSLLAISMAFGTLFMSNGVETYVCIIQSMNFSGLSLFIFKLIIGWPFAFHYLNGIRFAAWNSARLLNLKAVYATAKQAILGSIVIDVLFALL